MQRGRFGRGQRSLGTRRRLTAEQEPRPDRLAHTPEVLGDAVAFGTRDKIRRIVLGSSDCARLALFHRTRPHRTARFGVRYVLLPATFVVWRRPIDWTTCAVEQDQRSVLRERGNRS